MTEKISLKIPLTLHGVDYMPRVITAKQVVSYKFFEGDAGTYIAKPSMSSFQYNAHILPAQRHEELASEQHIKGHLIGDFR
jgi:hypothetical protein